MDIEYFGPNPEIEFWYLGALKAASKMAGYLKDTEFQQTCSRLFENGSRWTDQHLFNGEFYIQQIKPVPDITFIAAGLKSGMGTENLKNPDFQIGEGCLVDQLVGQNMAWICGLGWLADSAHIKKTLQSIWKYNHVSSFQDHFNNMRSYALGNESGLMLTAYPDPSKRPLVPLSYGFEAWTGLEYTAATGMYYTGMDEYGLQIISDVRSRYDGYKRNPFNEEECGNHYARAMASWSAIIAISGFHYSAVEKKFTMTSKPGNYFWSNGYSWGNATVSGHSIVISVHHGRLEMNSVQLTGMGVLKLKKPVIVDENSSFEFTFR